MTDNRDDQSRTDQPKDPQQVKDLAGKPVDEKDAEQVKGGLSSANLKK